jgi:hypothetical protein
MRKTQKKYKTLKKQIAGKIGKISKRKNNYNKKSRRHFLGGVNLQKLNCSPKPKGEVNNFSCYTNKALYKLRDLWNARHPDAKILSSSPKEIHKQLGEKLSGTCNKESCWLKQKAEFGKVSNDMADSFAPESPPEWKKNPNEWLSSIDIMKVMKQYEKANKCYDFIGPSPIDIDKRKL